MKIPFFDDCQRSSNTNFRKLGAMSLTTALLAALIILSSFSSYSQTRTISSSGSWSNTAIWSTGDIADVITEDADMNNNLGAAVTVPSNYTVGNITMNNGNILTINSGVTFNVGASGTPKSITSGNTGTININGTLIIWGDLNVSNNLDLNVAAGGVLIIKGNVNMGNSGDLTISGNVQIDGNFTGGTNTNLQVDGSVSIGGNISVDNGSTVSGGGTITHGGSCSDGSSNFCGTGPLPVKVINFIAVPDGDRIKLSWSTVMEKNFQEFVIQQSSKGIDFIDIASVPGRGRDIDNIVTDYSFEDNSPDVGLNYYRLKAIDLDDKFEYFNIVTAAFKGGKKIKVYPNPSSGENISYDMNFDSSGSDRLIVTNSLGVILANVHPGQENSIHFDQKLLPGIYFVRYVSENFEETVKVLVKN